MPSGGGVAGGGGGGGFGGGGGGFGGGGGGGAYYGGNRYLAGQPLYTKCIVFWTVLILITVVILALTLPIILPAVLKKSDLNIATDFYSPGDSRLHVFSSFFCESINLEVDSTQTGATLALVDSTPPLTAYNSFNISDQRSLRNRMFQFWQYHLYPGSNISVDVCISRVSISSSNRISAYLIKGNSNANRWGQNPASVAVPREAFRSVTEPCPSNSSIKYTVTEEDEYYVLLYNSGQLRSGTGVSYSATLGYERFEYALPNYNILEHFCSAPSGGQCTVEIPYGTGSQQALVVTTIPEDVDWAENVDVNVSCNRRGWAYAVVILLPLLTITAIAVSIVTGICFYCYKRKSRKGNNQ